MIQTSANNNLGINVEQKINIFYYNNLPIKCEFCFNTFNYIKCKKKGLFP